MNNSHDKILIESAVQFLHEAEGMDDTAYETPASYKPVGILPVEADDKMARDIFENGKNSQYDMGRVLRSVASKLGAITDWYGTTEVTLGQPLDEILILASPDELMKYPETEKALGDLLSKTPSPDSSYEMEVRSIWFSGKEVALRGRFLFAPSIGYDTPADLRVPVEILDTECFPQVYDALKGTLINRKRV